MAVEDGPFYREQYTKEVEKALPFDLPSLHQLMVQRKDNVFITSLCTSWGSNVLWHF